jgi:phage terminase large subunit-like protein
VDKKAIERQLKELKKRKIEILGTVDSYRKDHYLEFFEPHEKQKPVFQAVEDRDVRTILYQGGNRSGKTTWNVASVVSMLLGYFPWNKRLTRFPVPVRGRLCGEDNGHHLREVLIPKLKEMVPPEALDSTRRNQQGLEAFWKFKNGSTLELMSYEQSTDIYEGWSGHFVSFDEPPPRDKYVACQRGLIDYNGICLMSLTPLKEPWIYDEIVTKGDIATRYYTVDTLDNPHLSREAIDNFERTLTDEEKETRLRGGWLFLQGLVYKDYTPGVHRIKSFDVPRDWSVYVAIDTHPRTEQALMFMAVDEKERYYVVHDVFKHGSPEEVGQWILEYHDKIHPVDMAIIEPGSQGDTNRGCSMFEIIDDILSTRRIPLELGSRDMAGGILQVKRALRSANGLPSLFVFEDCERTHYEFTRYVWEDWRSDDKNAKQKPRDKDDHMMENLRRLIQFPVTFRDRHCLKSMVEQASMGYSPADRIAGY